MNLGGYGQEMLKSIKANKALLRERDVFSKSSARYKNYKNRPFYQKKLSELEKLILKRRIDRLIHEQKSKNTKVIVITGVFVLGIVIFAWILFN